MFNGALSNAQLSRENLAGLVIAYIDLRKEFHKIDQLRDHISIEVNKGYAIQADIEEGYDNDERGAKYYINDVIDDLEFWLKRAKLLRDHSHEWVDRFNDGRDLSCQCSICGQWET